MVAYSTFNNYTKQLAMYVYKVCSYHEPRYGYSTKNLKHPNTTHAKKYF